jgi:hypothetical protein
LCNFVAEWRNRKDAKQVRKLRIARPNPLRASVVKKLSAATYKMHDLQPVSVVQHGFIPVCALRDSAIQFHRNAVGLQSPVLDELGQRQAIGAVRLFSIDDQGHTASVIAHRRKFAVRSDLARFSPVRGESADSPLPVANLPPKLGIPMFL